MQARLRIGTRSSPLALAQTRMVKARLIAAHGDLDDAAVRIVEIKTTGDKVLDRTLMAIGGKGLFTKELEEALLDGRIDCAVHSAKDMPTALPDGLDLVCFPEREDPRDAFISHTVPGLDALPAGAVVGTASLRRRAQVLRLRPDLEVVAFRGNVGTRLRKLKEGQAHATVLALAGLRRLGLEDAATALMGPPDTLPAPAQGAICVEARAGDEATAALLAPLNDAATAACVAAERAFLAALDGSCRTPIAALARLDGADLQLAGRLLSPDGRQCFDVARTGPVADATRLGADAGATLRGQAGAAFFEQLAEAMAAEADRAVL